MARVCAPPPQFSHHLHLSLSRLHIASPSYITDAQHTAFMERKQEWANYFMPFPHNGIEPKLDLQLILLNVKCKITDKTFIKGFGFDIASQTCKK